MPARTFFLLWTALTLVGATLMALPDGNDRVFTITEGHGPAPLDFFGMLLVVLGFVLYLVGLHRARRRLIRAEAARALAAYVLGSVITGWSVATDSGWWWVLGLAIAYAGMGWLAWRVTSSRVKAAPPPPRP